MTRLPVTTVTLRRLWASRKRIVPEAVMLTTARLESGLGYDLYDCLAERFEQTLYDRRGTNRWTSWLQSLGFGKWLGLPRDRNLFTSYGLFQIMGFNLDPETLNTVIAWQVQANSRALTADAADSYILLQMEVYDQFMGSLLDRWKTDKAFERYNGSGPAARKYAARAMAHLATLTPPPGPA